MKNKLQVKHYLSNKSFATDFDFDLISSYCSQQLKISLGRSQHSDGLYPLSCKEFIDWFNDGINAGKVVDCGDFQGILLNSTPKEALVYAKKDRNAPNFDFYTVPIQVIQPVDETLANRLYTLLHMAGKEFNWSTLEISDKYVPEPGDIVMFSRINSIQNEKMYGIVRGIEDFRVTMYCYCDEKDEVRYTPGLREEIGRLDDFQFTKINTDDYGRKKLESLLNKKGMSWNHSAKRIESQNMRAEPGKLYYYLSDKMTVMSAKEDRGLNTVAAKRCQAGNYSKVYEKMLRCQKEVVEVLKKYMAEPE